MILPIRQWLNDGAASKASVNQKGGATLDCDDRNPFPSVHQKPSCPCRSGTLSKATGREIIQRSDFQRGRWPGHRAPPQECEESRYMQSAHSPLFPHRAPPQERQRAPSLLRAKVQGTVRVSQRSWLKRGHLDFIPWPPNRQF